MVYVVSTEGFFIPYQIIILVVGAAIFFLFSVFILHSFKSRKEISAYKIKENLATKVEQSKNEIENIIGKSTITKEFWYTTLDKISFKEDDKDLNECIRKELLRSTEMWKKHYLIKCLITTIRSEMELKEKKRSKPDKS